MAGWLLFAALCWLVLNGRGAGLDEAGLMFWRQGPLMLPRGPVWLLEGVRDLTALGGVLLRNLAVAAGAGALWAVARRREAMVLMGTVMGGWVVEAALKLAVGRARPVIVPHLTEAGGASFPSGHSFNAALVYLALALAFVPEGRRRWAACATAMALSLAIAVSRVWLGVHYPTDALAGWLGGTAWAFTAAALLDRPAQAVAAQA
jgi:undecaprenyl-diphosphatase